MEQIYYTQCPMGYGLGASNGFQIKRIGAGYPASGDVRHLAFRAFLPGSNGKALAPGTLRYRRVGDLAEVAWLEPRAREYETERGQWGRPGGHFAHGVRLGPSELAALACWPAGLFGRPFWRRSDPEPTRNRRPDDLAIGPESLVAPPDFAHVAPLVDLDAEPLARLLAATAEAVRSGRVLVLIDDPERLGPRIAALTFAFPTILRTELTLSTYHDRPEELSGFRVQGTVPSPLLNRAVLAGLGPIADLTADRFEPSPPPPSWARSLATWLTRRAPQDADDWAASDARAGRAQLPQDPTALWSDSWLDGLIGQADLLRSPPAASADGLDWSRLARQAAWADGAGLAGELADALGPAWWASAARDAGRDRDAQLAFWAVTLSRSSWPRADGEEASAWGAIASRFWARANQASREQVLALATRRIAPEAQRSRFLDGLIRSVPAEPGQHALDWLSRRGEATPEVLLPLRARLAVRLLRENGRPEAIAQAIGKAIDRPRTLPTVLDLIADEAGPGEAAQPVAAIACEVLEQAPPDARATFERWALARTGPGESCWLAPAIRLLFATEIDRNDWDALLDRTPAPLRPALATTCLAIATGPGASPSALVWSVESVVLRLDPADRPASPDAVAAYLDRVGSPARLARRLVELGGPLASWIDSARGAGGLEADELAHLADAEAIGRLIAGRAEWPAPELLARLPDEDRAPVLALLVDRLAGGRFEAADPVLDRCVRAWPGAFNDGATELDRLAGPLAMLLWPEVREPSAWIERLEALRGLVGVAGGEGPSWPPGGIAAAVVAESCRRAADPETAWALRSALLRDDRAYRALAEDLRRDLADAHPSRASEVGRRWALALDKGEHSDRFFEILLNVCDGPRLGSVVPDFARELRTLGPLPWWGAVRPDGEASAPEQREAYTLLAPMAPLPSPRIAKEVEAWLFGRASSPRFTTVLQDLEPPADLFDGLEAVGAEAGQTPIGPLPARARARWGCLRALTEFSWQGKSDEARWADLTRWKAGRDGDEAPPLAALDPADRAAFVAWVVLALEHPGAGSYRLEALARWIAKDLGLHPGNRVARAIEAIAPGHDRLADRRRLERDLLHQINLQVDG